MLRIARIAALAAVLLLIVGAGVVWADSNFPDFSPAPSPENPGFRGPGFYLNWVKILVSWLLFLLWVKTTDWASTDGQDMKLDYLRWNSILFYTFFASVLLLWVIPTFWIGFPLMVLAYAVPLGAYIVYRNARVQLHQKVLTPDHLRYRFAQMVNAMGGDMALEKADPHEIGPPVKVFAHGGPDEVAEGSRLAQARQTPGLTAAREILAEGLTARATAIMLDYTQQGAAMRTLIDGVWIPRESRSREMADPALESLKVLCGLNPQDRQGRQQGKFLAEYEKAKLGTSLAAQGTANGRTSAHPVRGKEDPFQVAGRAGHALESSRTNSARHWDWSKGSFSCRPRPGLGCAPAPTLCCTVAIASSASSGRWKPPSNATQSWKTWP